MKFNNNYFKDPVVLEELVSKLIGPIYPESDSYADLERLENIKIYGKVIKSMVGY